MTQATRPVATAPSILLGSSGMSWPEGTGLGRSLSRTVAESCLEPFPCTQELAL